MAIFRKGVKVTGQDIRVGLTKKRGQGILRKLGVIEDKRPITNDGMGDVQTIRTLVGMGEGFTRSVNYRCTFAMPAAIQQQSKNRTVVGSDNKGSGPNGGKVKYGSLDWRTHIMQNSTHDLFKQRYDAANAQAQGMFKQFTADGKAKLKRAEQKMNLYCSKVSIPEKVINFALPRQYSNPFPWPQTVQYGTITTTFYCDGVMEIKNFFDAWQKLIYNDMTGNFNFYDEYTAHFDIHTRTTLAVGGQTAAVKSGKEENWATKISTGIKEATAKFDEITGQDAVNPRAQSQAVFKKPKVDFRDNYGVKVMKCFPATVGSIDLGHDSGNVSTFDVVWAYEKWNTFKLGGLGNRSEINLSIGELRNEKDGFPFLEDLPPELSGPLTGALDQAVTTSPLSKASNLLG